MVPGHPHNPTSRINKPQALCFLPEFRIANTWVRCYGCGLRDFGPVGTKGRCQGKPRRDGEAKEIRPTASARRVSIIGLMLVHAVMSSSIQVHTGGGNRHNVLVTGANRGLGLEIARGFAQLGHCVIITSRDTAAGTQAAFALQEQGSDVVYHPLDLASKTSIQSLISSCMNGKLPTPTILVNNGAICLEGDSREILSHTLAVNYYGAKYLTEGLLAHVAARGREGEEPKFLGSRSLGNVRTFVMEAMGWDTKVPQGGSAGSLCVVNVSSGDGEVAFLCSGLQEAIGAVQTLEEGDLLVQKLVDNLLLPDQELAFGPTPAYSVSKAMLNVYTRLQAAAGVGIIAVCPGDVSTRMCSDIGSPMLQSPQEAAQDVIWAALNEECMPGTFFRHRQPIPW